MISHFENQIVTEQETCRHVENRENTSALSANSDTDTI